MRQRPTLLWMACGEEATATGRLRGFLADHDAELLWHPSLSLESPRRAAALMDRIIAGRQALTLLCVEGGLGGCSDTFAGRPKRELVAALSERADYVLVLNGPVDPATMIETMSALVRA